ncbi:MAG TPA: alpha-isopropylmalate synthase regulatory domain-containing protein [Longimicrobiales bacterium]|nr:alpha-isopropylmalate synthase regulatory domain-containing protein [Longimicrobiales bacterium]
MTAKHTPTGHVQLLDTTLRDGEQTRHVSFSTSEKVSIAEALLGSLGVDRIEVASAAVSEGEKEAVARISEWAAAEGYADRVEVLGFVDGERSADWIASAGARVMNLLTKGSERHCRMQLRKSLEEHLADIARTVEHARAVGLAVNVYLEDWSNGYRDSRDYVYALVEGLEGLGVGHVMLPDTLGVMTPEEVETALSDMIARFPDRTFDFHPHNDYGLATANVMAAVRAGVRTIHCTVNCLGERAGNVSLAEVAVVLRDKMGMTLSIDESKLVSLSRMVENFSGKRVADNAPIVGADVFTQTSGIHADGDQKAGLYQTPLSPERFDRTRTYALGKMSGKASLKKNLEELGIRLSPEDEAEVLRRIVRLGDSKATITREDLPFIIADVLETKEYRHIDLLSCSVTSGLDLESTASIRVRINDEIRKASGSGNGGFDAFIDAIRKVLPRGVELPELVDYELRIPKGGSTSALTEVLITWRDGDRTFRTRGVNANQVFAGVNATLRMLNVRLHQTLEAGALPAAPSAKTAT